MHRGTIGAGELVPVSSAKLGVLSCNHGLDRDGRTDRPLSAESNLRQAGWQQVWPDHFGARIPTSVVASIADLSDHAALALAQALLHAEVEHLANHEGLTGLQNRRAAFAAIEAELHRAERSDLTLALVFLDLDLFKALNDSLGHDAGDDVPARWEPS